MDRNHKSFKKYIKDLFFKYALITILILFILFSIFIVIVNRVNVIINTKQASSNINNQIEEIYNNYYNEVDRMSSSNNVISCIHTRLNSNHVYNEYYDFINKQKVKGVLNIVDSNGVFLISTNSSSNNTNDHITNDIIPKLNKIGDYVLSEIDISSYKYNKTTTYTFAKKIKDNNVLIGYLIYQLYEDEFEDLLFQNKTEISIITDSHNRIIATNNNSIKGLMNKFSPKYCSNENYVTILGEKYYINRSIISNTPLYVYTLNSTAINRNIFVIYFAFIILMGIVLVFIINYLANRISESNSKSIDKLIVSVNELKNGNMNAYVNIKSGDEFEVLAHEYNVMLDNLNELIRKNSELVNLTHESEIKVLQSQFNPHFIFNILETLRYSVLINPKESEKIILGLSKLLRYSIKNDNQKVILSNDIEYIEEYLNLNKFRFKEKLKYTIDISDSARKALIPKLLLQAIVENSIKYGYKHKENLEINILGNIIDYNLILEVSDNGSGMTEEELININSILNNPNNTSSHIGLHNSYRRLVLLYGDKQKFQIKSILDKGTYVKILIPYEEGNFSV